MSSIISAYQTAKYEILRQGTLVSYVLPYAKTLELTGRQLGIVLSREEFNQANDRPCICPILYGATVANETFGIRVPTRTDLISYLRPDLSHYIARSYGLVASVATKNNTEPCLFPQELTLAAVQQFIDIIRPTEQKRLQRGQGFLAYGEIGWSEEFPRPDADKADKAPIINLTPPEIYSQTGMALVTRAYSHTERYNPRHDVAIGTHKWFDQGFFNIANIRALPVKGTLARRSGCKSFYAGDRALKGFAKKQRGIFDHEAYAEIVARYSTPVGRLPAFIISAARNAPQFTYR